MVNIIWCFLIVISIIYSLLTGNISSINDEIILSGKSAFNLILTMLEVTVLWTGILQIAEKSGLLRKFAKFISPILSKLFPSIPKGHESLDYISSNVAANMMGLGSAATPFGLKAMKSLQEINENKKQASDAMITFLVLNTSGVTIIPTTVIAMRMASHSSNPSEIILTAFLATICSSVAGLTLDYLIRRKNK